MPKIYVIEPNPSIKQKLANIINLKHNVGHYKTPLKHNTTQHTTYPYSLIILWLADTLLLHLHPNCSSNESLINEFQKSTYGSL